MSVNCLDLTVLFHGDGEKRRRDDLLVGEVQVGSRCVALMPRTQLTAGQW